MDVFYTHQFVLPLPAGHRFPMAKYERLYRRVAAAADGLALRLLEAAPASDEELRRAHAADYVARVSDGRLSEAELRRIGFPWSPAMVERSRRSSGATRDALLAAIRDRGIAVNLAGGTHHAHHDRGGGYCVFNDAVVAARHAQALGVARRVLIVDLDVHHGDGTASICADDPSIYTFSMHGARNYPSVKPPGDLDVGLPDGCSDEEYLALLRMHLPLAIARSGADVAIYLAGADPYFGDRLGHLALSKAGLAERDRMVFSQCATAGMPLAVAMAGGYAEQVDDIVDIHFSTVAAAARAARGRV